ncbi:hypothetical protein BD311DRAFT_74810 [Dichomitus squalens]|uniref:RTA1 like protein-domain-containing protein n=1 Tax=Dichomitus squalens TaxID=114155 RepID=A0A4Q9MZJ9_9APHY|nr:hypothetical protein BD311DRAFT_74810 [Dichomitus squalens]
MACMVCSDFQAARTFLQPSTMAAHPRIDDTFGSVLIGTFVGLVMYGMSLQQALRYFRLYPTDSWRLKVTIAVLLLLDTMHMVEASHTCYYYLASYYFDPKAMLYGVWSIRLLGVTYGIIIIIVQSFYCLRISRFVPAYYKYLVMFLAPLLLAELGLVITAAVQETIVVTFVRWKHYAWIDVIFLVIALVVDTMLAGALVVILHKSRTGTTTQTESLLDVLITYTVNTCKQP